MISQSSDPPDPIGAPAGPAGGVTDPLWHIALTEVARRFPALDADDSPGPLPVVVGTFMRHLLDRGPGPESPAGDGHDRAAPIAGGIEGWLQRLASAEESEVAGFLSADALHLVRVKLDWGEVFQQLIEPIVRKDTIWGARPWPTTLKDQVALLGDFLSKDPPVIVAAVAAVVLGIPGLKTRTSSNQLDRRIQQVERLLVSYFTRLGCRGYCEFVQVTALECFSPFFRTLNGAILVSALHAIQSMGEAAEAHELELAALARERRKAMTGKKVDVAALRREKEKEKAVTAARLDAMAASAGRVRLLETRVRELEAQLDTVRRRAARDKAYFEQQMAATTAGAAGTPSQRVRAGRPRKPPVKPPATSPLRKAPIVREPATPAGVSEARSLAPSLAGRRVFLYTNRQRGAAREAFVTELQHLGASAPKVYETKGKSVPGPTAFPPQSVVIIDMSFMSHTCSNVIRRRARASHETLLVEDHFGVGGLAERLARVTTRKLG